LRIIVSKHNLQEIHGADRRACCPDESNLMSEAAESGVGVSLNGAEPHSLLESLALLWL